MKVSGLNFAGRDARSVQAGLRGLDDGRVLRDERACVVLGLRPGADLECHTLQEAHLAAIRMFARYSLKARLCSITVLLRREAHEFARNFTQGMKLGAWFVLMCLAMGAALAVYATPLPK